MSTFVNKAQSVNWMLSGQVSEDQPVRQVHIVASPFTIGRRGDASLSIPSGTVSRDHAEITIVNHQLQLCDLGSTNGTFLNGARVHQPCIISHGDLLQFGSVVFRVTQRSTENVHKTVRDDSCDRALALIQFDQLVTDRAVAPHFQPIITLDDQRVVGYEVLGRSRLFGLKDPQSMFSAARVLNLEGELSRMLRDEGVHSGGVFPVNRSLFVNTHPIEMKDLSLLIFSLRELREQSPERPLTLEIHEAAVTCSEQISELRMALKDLDIKLAYDDFGAGQARLVELVEVPPDYLKFDMQLVQNLKSAPADRQKMIESLVKMVRDLGITALAEGIETEPDHEICKQLGFTHAQGFLYGHPELPKNLL